MITAATVAVVVLAAVTFAVWAYRNGVSGAALRRRPRPTTATVGRHVRPAAGPRRHRHRAAA